MLCIKSGAFKSLLKLTFLKNQICPESADAHESPNSLPLENHVSLRVEDLLPYSRERATGATSPVSTLCRWVRSAGTVRTFRMT